MEEKKKSSKGLICLVIILLLVVCGLVGYIVYDKVVLSNPKDNTEEKNIKNNSKKDEKKEEESIDFSDAELEKYVGYFPGAPGALQEKDEIKASTMSIGSKIHFISHMVLSKEQLLKPEEFINEGNSQYDAFILESDVKDAVELVYGPNTYSKTTFNLGCGDYVLNETAGKYYTKTGCGSTSAIIVSNEIIDYEATKSKLEITTSYAFLDGMTNKINKDYGISIDDYNGDANTAKDYLKEYVKTNKDKLNHIVYSFESSDGVNYYFTSMIKKK